MPPPTQPELDADSVTRGLAPSPGASAGQVPQPPGPGHADGRFLDGPGTDLRARTARGTVINAAFLAGLNALGVIRGVVVAGALGAAVYGLWGLLAVTFATLFWLAAVGVDDKYIQQDHADQRHAFQLAFTLQAMLCAAFLVAVVAGVPLFALLYGRPDIIAPGLALGLGMPAIALQTPVWVFYRRMEFARQRMLQAVDPVVSLAVTVALLLAGLELWALIIATLVGAWTAAAVIVRASPYPLAFRYEPGALREYASFSWPLFVGSASAVLVVQIPTVIAARSLGVAAIGAMTLAANLSQFTTRVDDIVTQTLYPAICAVKDRRDLLFETFSKSNRLALLWAVPGGAGIVLFAPDLVPAVLGDSWRFAIPVVQIFGGIAAVNQVAFNWTAFFRARAETRPIAVGNVVLLATGLLFAVPLLLSEGVTGYAAGMGAATVLVVATRLWYCRRLFPELPVARHVLRGAAPAVPAIAAVLVLRALADVPAPLEAALFLALVAAATAGLERELLREVAGYLRRGRGRPAPSAAGATSR